MVKIHADNKTVNGTASIKDKEASFVQANSQSDKLPEANLELVQEARNLLKKHYESDLEQSKQLYSQYHYDELIEPDAPNSCWRYLLHRDLDVIQAVELMKATLIWRKTNNIDSIQPHGLIKDFWLRAPIGIVGKTKKGHDIVYAVGKNYRKPDPSIRQTIRDFVAYVLFNWDREHRYDLEQLTLVFDVRDTGLRNTDLDFSAWLVSIRDYVPARVNAVYFVGIPFIIRPIIKLIISWLPERYKRIVHCGSFEDLILANIEEDQLPQEAGGLADNSWRLAPIKTRWVHELDSPKTDEIFTKICEACSFNTTQEQLDSLYAMQRDHESRVCAAIDG